MQATLLLAVIVLVGAACSDEPVPDATTSAGPNWLSQRPENAYPYADDTLARFRKLVDGDGWRDHAWNAQGTLEAGHVKTGLVFVLVPGGSFRMGSIDGCRDEKPAHEVTLGSLLLSKTECTQRVWVRGGGKNGSHSKGEDLPVDSVNWDDSHAWCEKLGLRLPSESEWEYACRAGSGGGMWCCGNDESNLKDFAVYGGDDCEPTSPVGGKRANAWGLFDMHGNVWEWCEDAWHDSYAEAGRPDDGRAWTTGGSGGTVCRGGSWSFSAFACRSAIRYKRVSGLQDCFLGFRPAASLPPK